MKKNGFISMSLIYAFFILFIAIMVAILVNYAHSRVVLRKLNKEIVNELESGEVANLVSLNVCDATSEYSSSKDLVYLILADSNVTKNCGAATLSKAAVQTVSDANNEVAENGIYTTLDNDGLSFYYRGNVTRNYVSFGGFIWRIVRINGDGTIRLVLNGLTSSTKVNTTTVCSSGCAGANSKYSTLYVTSNPPNETQEAIAKGHVDYVDSDIETSLNSFYDTYLASLNAYITSSEFCNDKLWSSQSGSSWYYSPYSKIASNSTASLTCSSEGVLIKDYYNDAYKLTKPIGLLSGDEVIFAGGKWNTANTSYYLYNSSFITTYWWTMSPSMWYEDGTSYAMYVDSTGFLYNYAVNYSFGVRPVINLVSGVTATGIGTSTDPYVIEVS
jgi:hypothetical protein